MTSPPFDRLLAGWREKAAGLAGYSDAAAKAFAEAADDLDRELRHSAGELLNLSEAARRTGYSPDHIARLVRRGVVPNYGAEGHPKVRLGDLPRKAPTLAARRAKPYDLDADARTLVAARKAPK